MQTRERKRMTSGFDFPSRIDSLRCARFVPPGLHAHTSSLFKPARNVPGKSDGFTLIELLIVFVIAISLAVLAVPSVRGFFQKNELETAARVVWSDMQSAKMTAIKCNQSVTVQLLNSTSYSYSYTDALSVTHTFHRNLSEEYPGVTISLDSGTTVTFRATGMGEPGTTRTVILQNPFGTRSFSISWTGRVATL